jgi:AAA15 family ATPase/GTPase
MHIKKLYINNFRGYRNFTLNTQEKTNILTGVNNSGKTTILEAISLWNEIFNYLIVIAQKRDLNLNLLQGDYRFEKKYNNYLDYRQINSVRSFGYKDVFFNLNTASAIEISATIELPENEEIEIGFIIKEANGNNYNVSLKNHDQFNFRKFNDSFQSLPNSIGCYFSSPVATVSSYEEFALKPKINEGIKTRQSFLFFRNRLYDLYTGDEFQVFKTKLSQIIYGEPDKFEFNITGDKNTRY